MPSFQQKKYKERASNSRYQSYVFSRNGTLYFRITVLNHLQSLIKKKELRRSLNTAKLKEARPLTLKLATLSMQYFELLEKIQNDVIQFDTNNLSQLTNINGNFYNFTDTFWLNIKTCNENIHELFKIYFKPLKTNHAENISFPHTQFNINKSPNVPSQQAIISNNLNKKLEDHEQGINLAHAPKNIISQTLHITLQHTVFTQPLFSSGLFQVNNPTLYQLNSAYSLVNQDNLKQPFPIKPYRQINHSPTLKETYHAFVEAKKLIWTPASTKDIPLMIKQFIEIIEEIEKGKNIFITDLTREHIRKYFEVIKNLPNRINKNSYKNKSWHKLA